MQTAIKRILSVLNSDATLSGYIGATASDPKIYPSTSVDLEKLPCITYEVIDASFRFPPVGAQDITLQLDIFVASPNGTLIGKQLVENIYTTINDLLNYYQDSDPLIVWIRQALELDNNETDRGVWRKTLRYQIVSKN